MARTDFAKKVHLHTQTIIPQPITDLLLKGTQVMLVYLEYQTIRCCLTFNMMVLRPLRVANKPISSFQATHFCAKHMMSGTPVGDAFK